MDDQEEYATLWSSITSCRQVVDEMDLGLQQIDQLSNKLLRAGVEGELRAARELAQRRLVQGQDSALGLPINYAVMMARGLQQIAKEGNNS